MNIEEIDYWLKLFSDNNHAFMSKDGKKTTLFKVFDKLKKLQQENQELKKQLHEASLTIQEMTEQDIECPSNCKKLRRLNKELQENTETLLGRILELRGQQKEFIKYLEDELDRLARECSQIYEDSLGKTRLVSEDIFDEANKILSKYKSIIGDNK